ncbi:hypothetical protein Syun_011943 [Stephania yunnanensis]|uniref:Uncharacterized protein n=1 Tax=Stephania yunnanensis TaxID=152371 RepID=A0AAP0JYG6_9MAGN
MEIYAGSRAIKKLKQTNHNTGDVTQFYPRPTSTGPRLASQGVADLEKGEATAADLEKGSGGGAPCATGGGVLSATTAHRLSGDVGGGDDDRDGGGGGGSPAKVQREMFLQGRQINNKLYVYNAFDLHLHYISSLPHAATTVAAQSVIRDRKSPPPPSALGPLGGLIQVAARLAVDREDGGGGKYDGDGGGGGFSATMGWQMEFAGMRRKAPGLKKTI